MTPVRSLQAITNDINANWPKVNYAAKPYLAMFSLNRINDKFYYNDARSVVAYFLANAQGWRGDNAKRIKTELKAML